MIAGIANSTPFSNSLEILAILLILPALVYTYRKMVSSTRQGGTLWGCMIFLFTLFLVIFLWSEYHTNRVYQTAGGMKGKETRF
jgi:K+-transporting ATPase A subunit